MTTGTTVYRAQLWVDPLSHGKPYYITTAEVSDVIVNGEPMVRMHDVLVPINQEHVAPWRATKKEAMRDAWNEMVKKTAAMQAATDLIYCEIEGKECAV